MKILAVSDQVLEHLYSPCIKDRFRDVDLVVGCGDLPPYYLEFLVSMLNVPLLQIPGNHDAPSFPFSSDDSSAPFAHRGDCGNIDGRLVREHGLLMAGLGGSMRYRPGPHQYTEMEMAARVARLIPRLWWNRLRYGRFLDIVVTHAPPKGIHDGVDPAHVGFAAFNRVIAAYRPRYFLHGHSHVYRRDAVTSTQVGRTLVLNVCPYRLIEVPDTHAG